jgi:hypothetical protein
MWVASMACMCASAVKCSPLDTFTPLLATRLFLHPSLQRRPCKRAASLRRSLTWARSAAKPCPAGSAVSSITFTANTNSASVASEPWAQLCGATSCGMSGLTAGCFNFVTGTSASPAGPGTSSHVCGAGEIVQAVYAVWDNLAVQDIVGIQCRRANPHRCCTFREIASTINAFSGLFIGDDSQRMSDWHAETCSPASPPSCFIVSILLPAIWLT